MFAPVLPPPTFISIPSRCFARILLRSGTWIGLDVCTKLLKAGKVVDVVKVVDILRDDRGALVQHAAQLSYAFFLF